MPDTNTPATRSGAHTRKRIAKTAVAVLILLAAGVYTAVRVILATSYAAEEASRLLSRMLGVSVRISGLQETGGTVTVTGVRVANPAGFGPQPFLTLRSASVTPAWTGLLSAPRIIKSVRISGLTVNVLRNNAGWNYARFLKPGKSKPGTEGRVESVVVTDSAINANGIHLKAIEASVSDFSSTGSTTSSFRLSARGPGLTPVAARGTFRSGTSPRLDTTFAAGDLLLDNLARDLHRQLPKAVTGGSAKVSGRFIYDSSTATVEATTTFRLPERQGVTGSLTSRALYRVADDNLVIERIRAAINGITASAHGTVTHARTEGAYHLQLDVDPVNLARLRPFLPADMTAGGTVEFAAIIGEGSRSGGISRLSGAITLADGEIITGKGRFLSNLAGDAHISGDSHGISVTGSLRHGGKPLQGLVDNVRGTFHGEMTPQLLLTSGDARFDAAVSGGTARFAASYARRSVQGTLAVNNVSVPKAAAILAPKSPQPAEGTLTLTSSLSGSSPEDISGSLAVRAEKLLFRDTASHHLVSRLVMEGPWSLQKKKVRFDGRVDAAGTSGSKNFQITMRPHVAGKNVTLDDAAGTFGDTSFSSTSIAVSSGSVTGDPASFAMTASTIKASSPAFSVDNCSLTGRLVRETAGWSGEAAGVAERLEVKGAKLGRQDIRVTLRPETAQTVVTGIGGALKATATTDLKAADRRTTFSGALSGLPATTLSPLLGGKKSPALVDGTFSGSFSGAVTTTSGFAATASLDGRNLAVVDAARRSLATNAGIHAAVDVDRSRLVVRECRIAIADSVAVDASGSMDNYASRERQGQFIFNLPATPATALVDAFVNILPRPLQEATAAGNLGVRGNVAVRGDVTIIDGSLTAAAAQLDIPAQKMTVAGIDGTIPFSFRQGGTGQGRATVGEPVTRETYPDVLKKLTAAAAAGPGSFRIGKIMFGPTEVGPVVLSLHAADGTTYVDAVSAELYDGRLVGSGYLSVTGKTTSFTFNNLINGFSLRKLCDTYPSIKGYISGRVDGIASVAGSGFKPENMKGFLDLWTYEKSGEKKFVSKEFLQKIAGKKLKGIFFRDDRSYDVGEISAYLDDGFLTFTKLDLSHTNIFGVRDLSVAVAPVQNRIAFTHLLESIREAATRGKAVQGAGGGADQATPATEFKWQE